ncbi:MAG: sulfite oxidase-like oxidoreductase [Sulfolobaceae archaeon]|nr:sulfite oxidase-like oxidoreductase [Sulfolobaceae archaeon]
MVQNLLPPGQKYVKRFIIYAELGVPEVDISTYNLSVQGNVKNKFSLTYEELKSLSTAKLKSDFHCVTGWSVKDVLWEGVPFSYIINRAEPLEGTEWVFFVSADGYTSIVPFEDVKGDDAILALYMNGQPLSKEQGFPVRPIIAHLYGWKSAKWLTEIHFLKEYIDGYWEERGYHERGDVWKEERFKGMSGRHTRRRPLF